MVSYPCKRHWTPLKAGGARNSHTLKATAQEAMLFDWILTLHNYSPEYLDYLMKPDIQQLRYQVGRIIINGKGKLELLDDEIRWLLDIMPTNFRFGKENVGFSLKKKLCEEYLGKKTWFRSILASFTRLLHPRVIFFKHKQGKAEKHVNLVSTKEDTIDFFVNSLTDVSKKKDGG